MLVRRFMLAVAGCALVTGGAVARGGEETSAADLTLQPKYLADAPASEPAPRKPLMGLLDSAGLAKPLDSAGINVYGFIEGSYTTGTQDTVGHVIPGRVFDFKKDAAMLNQVDLTIERTVDLKKFDIGGRVELVYGSDAGGIHSNGLFDYYSASRAFGAVKNSPENQLDLVQAYLDLAIPVGNGIDLKIGKFVTCHGQETINPTTNALYSHSYLFGFAIPFTHTGALATYNIDDNWSVSLGFSRGWEQALDDNNDSIDGIGVVRYTSTDKKLSVAFNAITGPEMAGNNSDYRTCLDLVVNYTPDPKGPWSFALNGDYAWEDGAAPDGGTATWYGVAGYVGYQLCPAATLNARGEWFRDDDGTRVTAGVPADYYEVTVGLSLRPFTDKVGQNLVIRPEIRYDYASEPVLGDGTQSDQLTFAVDAIFTF